MCGSLSCFTLKSYRSAVILQVALTATTSLGIPIVISLVKASSNLFHPITASASNRFGEAAGSGREAPISPAGTALQSTSSYPSAVVAVGGGVARRISGHATAATDKQQRKQDAGNQASAVASTGSPSGEGKAASEEGHAVKGGVSDAATSFVPQDGPLESILDRTLGPSPSPSPSLVAGTVSVLIPSAEGSAFISPRAALAALAALNEARLAVSDSQTHTSTPQSLDGHILPSAGVRDSLSVARALMAEPIPEWKPMFQRRRISIKVNLWEEGTIFLFEVVLLELQPEMWADSFPCSPLLNHWFPVLFCPSRSRTMSRRTCPK